MASRKPEMIGFWLGRLPHWEVEDGRYFVTIRLAGAIPPVGCERLRLLSEEAGKIDGRDSPAWLRLQRKIFKEMEHWLDRAEVRSDLQRPEVAKMVVEAIEYRQKHNIWNVFEYVVMPSHIHLFCEVLTTTLNETLEDFKRWTGHRAGELGSLVDGRFWQREWFDHWSRSDEEDENISRYNRENPVKAGLVQKASDWPYGSAYKSRPE